MIIFIFTKDVFRIFHGGNTFLIPKKLHAHHFIKKGNYRFFFGYLKLLMKKTSKKEQIS